ncbi:hypothetical protein AJ78_00917 [Emergomyces pasteurianus Ep9510]|uniref:YMC020W-like alpha/beta hydrolase domain-containing protein n=1 Tax=Emergomyces pasteurianus Ep9510 TaxID=1447872 RepID=A0A1J9QG15_9EURO|nr:hypothetical protein AJ78_00917 [Emergomyces pasteurianus Ep9510]
MAPAGPRKRVKPNVPNNEGASEHAHSSEDANMNPDTSTETRTVDKQKDNGTSWYTRTWPRKPKAPAVTEVARESISAEGTLTPERKLSTTALPSQTRPVRSPSIGLTKKVGGSTRSLPAEVATTRINIASIGSPSVPDMLLSDKKVEDGIQNSTQGGSTSVLPTVSPAVQGDQATKELGGKVVEDAVPDMNKDGKENQQTQLTQTSGWLGWIPLPKIGSGATQELAQPAQATGATKQSDPEERLPETAQEGTGRNDSEQLTTKLDPKPTAPGISASNKRAWLQVWYPSSPQQRENWQNNSHMQDSGQTTDGKAPDAQPTAIDLRTTTNEVLPPDQNVDLTGAPSNTPKPSSWLFWYRDAQTKSSEAVTQQPERTDDATRTATQNQASTSITVSEPEPGSAAKKTQSIQTRPEDVLSDQQPNPGTIKTAGPTKDQLPVSSTAKIAFPNQVLPTLRDSFPVQERPGIIQQLGRLLYYFKSPEPRHVTLTTDPPRVKRALAIGIHGLFPAPLIRTVLGQPTGTSIKFSTMAAKAIYSWTESHGFSCEIQKIALEGEGRISERVDLLWKLLLDYIEDIKKADFILVACHSQGVPVATMLVAKLIAFGCVSSARISICAMAGVNLGPFPDYRSRWISGSAGELFDFANPKSKVSQDHLTALETALDFGVKIVYVGSIDDQLVSLESSIFASVSHPHIYRAVFVDGRVHAPSFLSHLVGFAMKLRNLGISDHGLIRELSSPLAGSLYTGEGHSRLYDDETVYRLAVEYTLETLPVPNAKLEVNNYNRSPNANPYILPFTMRGVLEEEFVRRELSEETTELLKLFDDWKPTSKVLKDVKFRLEGIRSKL